jgi:hypothetical protein
LRLHPNDFTNRVFKSISKNIINKYSSENLNLKLNFTFCLSLKQRLWFTNSGLLDAEEDIFRDIAILADDTLEDLHNAIFNSFFDGMEVASILVTKLGIKR